MRAGRYMRGLSAGLLPEHAAAGGRGAAVAAGVAGLAARARAPRAAAAARDAGAPARAAPRSVRTFWNKINTIIGQSIEFDR